MLTATVRRRKRASLALAVTFPIALTLPVVGEKDILVTAEESGMATTMKEIQWDWMIRIQ
jgi:hypothetical protein